MNADYRNNACFRNLISKVRGITALDHQFLIIIVYVIVIVYPFVIVTMGGFILSVDMGMGVEMFVFVGMYQVTMFMFMVVDMRMLVGVL